MTTCSSKNPQENSKNDEEDEEIGLILNHSYSLTGNYKVKIGKEKERFLKVSNPWGKQNYQGKWCDKNPNWTSQLKNEVKFGEKLKGEFYMRFQDFWQNFLSIIICKWDSFFDLTSLKLSHRKGSYNLIEIYLPTKSYLSVSIIQYMERLFDSADYKPANMRLMVAQKTNKPDSPFKHLFGAFKWTGDNLCMEASEILEKGTYYAYIELDWNNTIITEYTCNIIGYEAKVKEIEHNECKDFFK